MLRIRVRKQLSTCAAALLLSVAAFAATPALAVNAGDQAPAWQGADLLSGETVRFPELLQDRPAVMLFWATWCPYCKAFMPFAAEIQRDYAERGVQIVTVNFKERGRGDPVAYARGLGFDLIAVADPAGEIGGDYGIRGIPGLMVVDGAGRVSWRRKVTNLPAGSLVGKQWDREVRAALDQLLAESDTASAAR
ncbi:MAG: TlpA disulfide reductase family protein [Pseudomonadota bacterium]